MRCTLAVFLFCAFTNPLSAAELSLLPAEDHASWQAVGRINSAGYRTREMCTGALIAPDRVLTAAHCVSGTDGVGPPPEDLTFVAGWLRGTAADSVPVASVWVHPEAYARGPLDIRYDIAILTLTRPATVAPLPIATGEATEPFALLAYSTRRPHMLGASFACNGAATSDLLRLDCAVHPGNSGGPVLTQTDRGWAISAVVSAMGQDGALAVPVSRLSGRSPPTM